MLCTAVAAALRNARGCGDYCRHGRYRRLQNLPAKLKFVIQIIAALVVVFAGDIKSMCSQTQIPKRQSVLGTSRMAFGNAYCYMDCIHNKCGKLY